MMSHLDTPPPAAGGNGGPPLDERAIDTIARIGRAMHGERWIGRLGQDIGEDHQVIRRWLKGQGSPSSAVMERVRMHARSQALLIQRALGE